MKAKLIFEHKTLKIVDASNTIFVLVAHEYPFPEAASVEPNSVPDRLIGLFDLVFEYHGNVDGEDYALFEFAGVRVHK